MKPYSEKLREVAHVEFSPHYMVWSCPEKYIGSESCNSQCLMNGVGRWVGGWVGGPV